MNFTVSERKIMNIKERARLLEHERKQAYEERLREIVTEISQWNVLPETIPMHIAHYAFKLGREFGEQSIRIYLREI